MRPAPTTVERSSTTTERSLGLLAVGAVLAFCYVARELLLPSVLAVLLAFTVHPLVARLERWKVPHTVAAIVGTLVATAVAAGVVFLLYDRVSSFVQELPQYEDRLRHAYQTVLRRYVHLRAQSEQIVKPQPGSVRVQESVPWGSLLLGTAQGAIATAAAVTVAVFVLYFSLADGPRFREKLLRAAARSENGRERALAALEELHRDVEQYMLNRAVLNALLGVAVGLVYWAYGLEHPAVWGITTGLLHFVPYVGPAVGLVLPVAMAVLQYGTLKDPLVVGAIYVGLVSLQGNVVDPIFLGKQLRLNSLAVFLGSLFWFWIWGPIGLFVAVPLLSSIRIVCKHVPRVRFVAEFLEE